MRMAVAARLYSLSKNAGLVTAPESLVIRDIMPFTDLALAVGSDTWLTPALVAATEVTFVNNALNNKRHLAIYGFWTESATPAVSMLYMRTGATGATTYALYNLEKIYQEQETVGYFPEPIVYVPNETIFIRLLPRIAAAAGERFGLIGLVAEPKGEQISGNRVPRV